MDFSTYSKELHKPVVKKYPTRRVIALTIDEIWAADLIDFVDWAEYNNGYKYGLCVIDVFSKFAWIEPLKSKNASDVNKAFKDIMKSSKRKPKLLWADQGSEFYNKVFKETLKHQNIKLYSTFGENKASVIERFNRTIKEWLYKYFSTHNDLNWVEALPSILHFYNYGKKHRSVGMSPADASKKDNEQKVFNKLYGKYYKEELEPAKFAVGDIVRIARTKDKFEKGFHDNWTKELYKIKEVLPTHPRTYKLVDWHNEPIEGSFYNEELQITEVPDKRDIEEIIKTKTVKGKKMYLVKYIGWPSDKNEWIDKTRLDEIEKI